MNITKIENDADLLYYNVKKILLCHRYSWRWSEITKAVETECNVRKLISRYSMEEFNCIIFDCIRRMYFDKDLDCRDMKDIKSLMNRIEYINTYTNKNEECKLK